MILRRLAVGFVFIVEAVTIFLFERIDPDSFHSGLVYAQSIAVDNGLLPNKNFFSPYGVFGPLVNGTWLHLFNDSLLSLNLLYGSFIFISGYLVQRNIERYVDWKLAVLANLTWVMTLASVIPWPSILANLLILFAITILLNNKDSISANNITSHIYLIPVIVLLHLSILTRIHLVLTPVLITIILLIYRRSFSSTFVRYWFIGNTISILFFFGLMLFNGLLSPWIYQVIVWPTTEFDSPPITISYLFSLLWFPICLCFAFVLLKINIIFIGENKRRFVPALVINSFLFYLIYRVSTRNYDASQTATFTTLPGFLKNSSENLQFFIGFASAMLVLIGVFMTMRSGWRRLPTDPFDRIIWEISLIVILGLSGLAQLYPLHDNVHLWFVTPLLLIPAAFFSKNFLSKSRLHTKSLTAMLVGFLVIQGISAYDLFKVDRVRLMSYEERGLLASKEYSTSVDKTLILLDRNLRGRELRNNCIQGIFAVSGGKYNSIDGNFSANAYEKFAQFIPPVDVAKKDSKFILECNLSRESLSVLSNSYERIVFKVESKVSKDSDLSKYNVLFQRK